MQLVFPLGTYTVASDTPGARRGLGFMVSVARIWVFVGPAARAAVLALMLWSLARSRPDHPPPRARSQPG